MPFLAPLALIGAAILGPLIVAMYILKLRRDDRAVSSTFLWQRMVRDVEANAPWQKLRRNLLLLLQLLALLLLVLALARPFFQTTGIGGHNLIVLLDHSASMGATDVDADSRLAAAQTLANRLVDQLPDGGRATIIAAGGGIMEVPASATTDRRELREAINAIALRNGGGSSLAQPLALAAALAAREEQSEVAIISDGNVAIPDDLVMPATVRYFPIGQRGDNVAISALALQPGAGSQTLFVQVVNYGPAATTRRLDLLLDGELFNAYNLTLEPDQPQSVVVEVPARVSVAEALLAGSDALPLDDHAWAVSSMNEQLNIRLVSNGNYFLETALALLPGVQTTRVATATGTLTGTAAQVPVTILDRVVPQPLPEGNLFFIAPPASTAFFSITGSMEFPALRAAPGDDPLLRNVSLSDVSVLRAVRLAPGAWAREVVLSDGAPLLMAGEVEGRRIVVLAFDLHQSDLPLNVAFPLLLSNVVSYLAPGSGVEASQLAPGEPLALRIDPAITEVRLTRPDGSRLSSRGVLLQEAALRIQNNQMVYADTDMLGVYVVEEFRGNNLEARHRYAVNLFSERESRVAPQPELAVRQSSGLQSAVTKERAARQEFWRWLAALALLVLLVEWFVYHRAGIAALLAHWRTRRRAAG